MPLYNPVTSLLTSPSFSGTPTAPTATAGTATTQVATTAFVQTGKQRGALVRLSSDAAAQNYVTAAAVPWTNASAVYDTDSIWTSTANTRLTVPSGVTKVRLNAQFYISSLVASEYWNVELRRDGSLAYDGAAAAIFESPLTSAAGTLHTGMLTVTSTMYFELWYDAQADTSVTIVAANNWFEMEIIA